MQQQGFDCEKHQGGQKLQLCLDTTCKQDRIMCSKCQQIEHTSHVYKNRHEFYGEINNIIGKNVQVSAFHTQQKDALTKLIKLLEQLLDMANKELNNLKDDSLYEYLLPFSEKLDETNDQLNQTNDKLGFRKLKDLNLTELTELMKNIFNYIKIEDYVITETISPTIKFQQEKYLEIITSSNIAFQDLIQQFNNKQQIMAAPSNIKNKEIGEFTKQQMTQSEHNDPIIAVAFSQDSKMIASGGGKGQIKLWTAPPDIKLKQSYQAEGLITTLAFSNDNKILAGGGFKKIIFMWDITNTNSTNPIKELKDHSDTINRIAFSNNNQFLASCSDDCKLILWDYSKNKIIHTFEEDDSVNGLSISQDSRHVVIITGEGLIKIYDSNSYQSIFQVTVHSYGGSVQFSKDGKYLASSGREAYIILWNVEDIRNCKKLKNIEFPRHKESLIWSFQFTSNSQNIIMLDKTSNYIYQLWVEKDMLTKNISIPDLNGQYQYQGLDVSSNMQHIVVGDQKNNLITISKP